MNATKIAIIVIVIAAVGVLAYIFTRPQPKVETPVQQNSESIQEEPTEEVMESTNDENAVTIDLTAKNFEFSKKTIEVKKGQTVTVNLTVTEGFHDWTLDEFDAKTKQIGTDQSSSVTFVADKTGEFEYYCSVGNHRQMGMVGTITVTE